MSSKTEMVELFEKFWKKTTIKTRSQSRKKERRTGKEKGVSKQKGLISFFGTLVLAFLSCGRCLKITNISW